MESVTVADGVALFGGFEGSGGAEETLLSQRDVKANSTIIDASTAYLGTPEDHVVVMDSVTNTRLDGFSITGGVADGGGYDRYGGGIFCSGSDASNAIAPTALPRGVLSPRMVESISRLA